MNLSFVLITWSLSRLQSTLPTYEEATRQNGGFAPGRMQRPHWPSLGMRRTRNSPNPDLGNRQGSLWVLITFYYAYQHFLYFVCNLMFLTVVIISGNLNLFRDNRLQKTQNRFWIKRFFLICFLWFWFFYIQMWSYY